MPSNKYLAAIALFLFATGALAQVRVPPIRVQATLGACTDAQPKIAGITDGASATDLTVGGGAFDVIGFCQDGTWFVPGRLHGLLGTSDNVALRSNGTGQLTAQGSDLVIDDTAAGVLNVHPITATALTISTLDNNKDILLDPQGTGTVQAPGQGTSFAKNTQIGPGSNAAGAGTTYGSTAIGNNATASNATASGETSVGDSCAATGQWASCFGLYQTASGQDSSIFGGNSNTASGTRSTIINGLSAIASGNNTISINSGNASANNCAAILGGTCAHSQTLSAVGGATSQAGQVVFGGAGGWEVKNLRLYQSAEGAMREQVANSELITLSTIGATTDSSANLLPANSTIDAVACRITTTITVATDWSVGDPTVAARFSAANSTLTAGTTSVGMAQIDGTGTSGPIQTTAAKLRITTTGTPGAGAIRCTVFATTYTAPTS